MQRNRQLDSFIEIGPVIAMIKPLTLIIITCISCVVFGNVAFANTPFTTASSFNVGGGGSANFEIPIQVPPGTAGMEPKISLSYSSNGGNGLLGLGWQVSGLSQITRCPTADNIDFTGNDAVTHPIVLRPVKFKDYSAADKASDQFCLNGERLLAADGDYGAHLTEYRTEIADFSKIQSHGEVGPAYFKVWTKDGMEIEYGVTLDSRIESNTSPIRIWGINKVTDKAGNYMTMHYHEDTPSGEAYIEEIKYTGNAGAGLAPYASVKFIYEDRTDTRTQYYLGSKSQTNKRLSKILTYNGPNTDPNNLVKEYRISYETAPEGYHSRITQVQECSGSTCLKPIKFTWKKQTISESSIWSSHDNYALPDSVHIYDDDCQGTLGEQLIDLNGDGWDDFVYSTSVKQETWINKAGTWTKDDNYKLPEHLSNGQADYDAGTRFIDLNADGLPDLVRSYRDHQTATLQSTVWFNTGTRWSNTVLQNMKLPVAITTDGKDQGVRFLDLNGDGRVDLLKSYATKVTENTTVSEVSGFGGASENCGFGSCDTSKSIYDYVGTYTPPQYENTAPKAWINEGDSWREDNSYALPKGAVLASDALFVKKDYAMGAQFMDVNGDGLKDFIYHRENWYGHFVIVDGCGQRVRKADGTYDLETDGSFKYNNNTSVRDQFCTYINTGHGWEDATTNFKIPPTMVSDGQGDLGVRFVDLNGDGLVDIIESRDRFENSDIHNAWINTGNGWIDAPEYEMPVAGDADQTYIVIHDKYGYQGDRGTRFIDINGDGLQDFIASHRHSGQLTTKAWLNTGNGWDNQSSKYSVKQHIAASKERDLGVRFVDLNGDGMRDMLYSRDDAQGTLSNNAWINISQQDIIIEVDYGLGKKTKITYGNLTDDLVYTKGTTDELKRTNLEYDSIYPTIDVQSASTVVKKVEQSTGRTLNGQPEYNRTLYKYAGQRVHVKGRGGLGFKTITVEDTGVSDADPATKTISNYLQDYPFTGLLENETALVNDKKVSEEHNHYLNQLLNAGTAYSHFPHLSVGVKASYDFDAAAESKLKVVKSKTTYDFDDASFGNVKTLTVETRDNYNGDLKFLFTQDMPTSGDSYTKTHTVNTYWNNPTSYGTLNSNKWILGRLQTSDVTSQNSTELPTLARRFTDRGTTPAITEVLNQAPPTPNSAPTASNLQVIPVGSLQEGATVIMNAVAHDVDGNTTIKRMEFYVDDNLVGTDYTADNASEVNVYTGPFFSYNDWQATAGSHYFEAKAYDEHGAVGISEQVSLTFAAANEAPNTAPNASLVVNAGNTSSGNIIVGQAIKLKATVTTNENTIKQVEFLVDDTSVGNGTRVSATSNDYELDWTPQAGSTGSHTVKVRVHYGTNETVTTTAQSVEVEDNTTSGTVELLSQGKPTSQSSTLDFSSNGIPTDASLAVDGNYNGDFQWNSSNSLTHSASDSENETWWQVDLEQISRIERVKLWNRTDCCSDRLKNFYVFVSDSDMSNQSVDQLINSGTAHVHVPENLYAVETKEVTFNNTQGRYIKVQLAGQGKLSLAEVEVHGIAGSSGGGSTGGDTGSGDAGGGTTPPANQSPTVSIASPTPDYSVVQGNDIVITAHAGDVDGTVKSVTFYSNGQAINTQTTGSSPYSFTWRGASVGTHKISVSVTDDANAITTTPQLEVIVTEPPANTGNGNAVYAEDFTTSPYSVEYWGTDTAIQNGTLNMTNKQSSSTSYPGFRTMQDFPYVVGQVLKAEFKVNGLAGVSNYRKMLFYISGMQGGVSRQLRANLESNIFSSHRNDNWAWSGGSAIEDGATYEVEFVMKSDGPDVYIQKKGDPRGTAMKREDWATGPWESIRFHGEGYQGSDSGGTTVVNIDNITLSTE